MAGLKASIREALIWSPLYGPARKMYHWLNRGARQERADRLGLYRQFIRDGDLVFDVGANIGTFVQMFMELGARVVAIEPQKSCCERIARFHPLGVERVGVGAQERTMELRLDKNSELASFSDEWIEKARASTSFAGVEWQETESVPVTTLDKLAEKYGIPAFVKIDVEGFEEQVLRGMSFRPDSLSFEFHRISLDAAERCLAMLDDYEFNAILSVCPHLLSQSWMRAPALLDLITHNSDPNDVGDVFCRRRE